MRLELWAKRRRMSCGKLALLMGVDKSLAHRWLTGAVLPNRAHIARLFTLSQGQVRPTDFYDLDLSVRRVRRRRAAQARRAAEAPPYPMFAAAAE